MAVLGRLGLAPLAVVVKLSGPSQILDFPALGLL